MRDQAGLDVERASFGVRELACVLFDEAAVEGGDAAVEVDGRTDALHESDEGRREVRDREGLAVVRLLQDESTQSASAAAAASSLERRQISLCNLRNAA